MSQGCKTWILQDPEGQIELTHSVSAGLDYAAVGPEHAFYKDQGRIEFGNISDDEALVGFETLSRLEGIIPALETSHVVAYALRGLQKCEAIRYFVSTLVDVVTKMFRKLKTSW